MQEVTMKEEVQPLELQKRVMEGYYHFFEIKVKGSINIWGKSERLEEPIEKIKDPIRLKEVKAEDEITIGPVSALSHARLFLFDSVVIDSFEAKRILVRKVIQAHHKVENVKEGIFWIREGRVDELIIKDTQIKGSLIISKIKANLFHLSNVEIHGELLLVDSSVGDFVLKNVSIGEGMKILGSEILGIIRCKNTFLPEIFLPDALAQRFHFALPTVPLCLVRNKEEERKVLGVSYLLI